MKSTALPVDFAAWLSRPSHIGPRPRKPLKKASSKRAKQLREYSKRRREYIIAHPRCEAWDTIVDWQAENATSEYQTAPEHQPHSTEIHHRAKRGNNLNNESTWLAVCRWSHNWIHAHPKEARKLGLIA